MESKNAAMACELAIYTVSTWNPSEQQPENLYVMKKAKHKTFMIYSMSSAKLSNDTLSFLEKNNRETIAEDIIADAKNTPNTYSFCYQYNENFIFIFDIPCANGGMFNVTLTKYGLSPDSYTKKTYLLKDLSLENAHVIKKKIPTIKNYEGMYKCPKTGLLYPPCWFCGNTKAKTQRCAGCSVAYYCSKKCQKKDWKIHKNECMLRKIKN